MRLAIAVIATAAAAIVTLITRATLGVITTTTGATVIAVERTAFWTATTTLAAIIPARLAIGAGSLVDAVTDVRLRLGHDLSADPPITRFLAEQLSTAHWFDQRRTREVLHWTPRVSLDEGFDRLATWFTDNPLV